MKIILEGILENISTRSDGTVKLTIGSQEMNSSDAGRLFELRNKYLKVLLSDSNISALEETLIDEQKMVGGKKVKTQSQRMRSVLFRAWEQRETGVDFDTFYKSETEGIIDRYKSELE